jgi:tetratricopeptide (TPR) repeat protein
MRFYGSHDTPIPAATSRSLVEALPRQRVNPATPAWATERLCEAVGRVCVPAMLALGMNVLSVVFGFRASAAEVSGNWARQVEPANALVEDGKLQQADDAYMAALNEARRAGDDLRAAVVLCNLGRLRDRQGQALQAEKAFLEAIGAWRRAGVNDDRLLVRMYVGLSSVYLETRQYPKAEALIRRALADHPEGAAVDRASLLVLTCINQSKGGEVAKGGRRLWSIRREPPAGCAPSQTGRWRPVTGGARWSWPHAKRNG